ncbi:arylamine N-acetyltransferase family protein [Cytobacillus sp. FSL R7-0696]|uniref:arylamine N-acetyltransferase family protein n=1 Tax=Cytobacillus TaxID=2675230 RepID=UPI0030F99C81
MTDLTMKFKEKIHFQEKITFNNLDEVLRKTTNIFPFENTSIMARSTTPITKELIEETCLNNGFGGVCYHLNPLLFYVLKDEGLDVKLVKGNVYDHSKQTWSSTGDTHVCIILTKENKPFLVDTGFGNNLPLKAVPLDGEEVKSANGFFRITYNNDEYILNMKKNGVHDWKTGYKFSLANTIQSEDELTTIQDTIIHSESSPFNKGYLFTSIREYETITLTESSYTLNVGGNITKRKVTTAEFLQLAKDLFGITIKNK